MRSRTSPKIWLLMLIPVFVLLGIGWMQRDNRINFKPPRRTEGPLKIAVTDTKFEELKPREVAEGFDTKLTLTLDLEGQLPAKGAPFGLSPYVRNVRLVETGAKPRITKLNDDNVWVLEDDKFTVPLDGKPHVKIGKLPQRLTFLLSLSKMNQSARPLELRASISSLLQAQFKRGGNIIHTAVGSLPFLYFSQVVRQPNQVVQLPKVSKRTDLTLGEPTFSSYPARGLNPGTDGFTTSVTVPMFWKGNSFKSSSTNPQIHVGIPYIEDARGKKYRNFKYGKSQSFRFNYGGIGSSSNGGNVIETSTSYSFPANAIPYKAGQLTFKTQISGNDEWPVPVSVVVRRADEKQLAQPPFKIVSTQVNSITDDKGDTEVVVKIQPALAATDIETFRRELITYWSQRLVDAQGMEYQNFAQWITETSYPNGIDAPAVAKRQQQTRSMDTSQEVDQQNRQIVVRYKFFLNQVQMKTGCVLFKADIGMKGYKFLPLSVVVRP